MSGARMRRLSDAEIEIWLQVARSVTARPGASLPERKAKPQATPQATPTSAKAVAPEPPRRGPSSLMPSYAPPLSAPQPPRPARPLVPFEKRFRQQVSRGHVEIERVMDLHGLTQTQAHGALHGFLRSSQMGGARLVLVVTGKGRGRTEPGRGLFDGERGVLRRLVPAWLRAPELRAIVLGFEEASLPHGGMGALYVRLRKAERER